jgi:hypothetical protein
MASVTRPQERLGAGADIRPYTTAGTVRQGMPVKLSSGSIVEATAIGDDVIGIAYEQLTNSPQTTAITGQRWTAPSGVKVNVCHLGKGVCPVLVGTGGATQGKAARPSASGDGACDATVGGGTTKITILGQFMDVGVAGDLVGCNLGIASQSVGS